MLWWPQNPVVWWLQSGRCSWPPGRTSPTRTKPSSRSRTAPSAQVGPNPPRGALKGLSSPQLVLSLFLSPPQDAASSKLQGSNIFTIAKRTVEGQDMLYQSLKLTNGIWVLAELRIQPSNPTLTVRPPHPPLPPPFPLGGTRGVPIGSPSPRQRDAGSPQPQKSLGCSPLSPSSLPFSWLGGARCHPAVPWGLSPSLGVQPELLAPHNPPPPYF